MMPSSLFLALAEVCLSGVGFWAVHKNHHGTGNWVVGLGALILFGHAMSIALKAF